jgi:hypothetical protein
MVAIYFFSNMSGSESNGKSKETINVVIEKVLVITNKLGITDKHPSEVKMNITVSSLNFPLRKFMHASVYFILSILLYGLFCFLKTSTFKKCILPVVFSFLYACTDEYHQLFVKGRNSRSTDVLIDTVGAILGVIFISIIVFIIKKIKKHKALGKENKEKVREKE